MSSNVDGWERIAPAEDTPEGIARFRLSSWSKFFDFLETEVFDPSSTSTHNYVWRGQRRHDWSLSSSLDRLFHRLGWTTAGPDKLDELTANHLDAFKLAARGRRGHNPARFNEENEWWALGQHYGLATPLLDWTQSPFAAAYFAFEEPGDDAGNRVVYGLDRIAVERRTQELSMNLSVEHRQRDTLSFFEPMSDENQRLVSQGGLFTRAPVGIPVEQWISQAFESSPGSILLKVEIPGVDRLSCLRALNRMNINHLSLFPDLTGASRATNLRLELQSQT